MPLVSHQYLLFVAERVSACIAVYMFVHVLSIEN
jgi:hypothetical protein